jgi:ArsR family transcriptional regulator
MKDFVKVMKALSDPNRVKIIKMLQYKKLCVCEIQALLEISQHSVSKHLKILESAGIVASSKDGLWVNYHLADGSGSPYVSSLLGNLRHWLDDDPHVLSIVQTLPEVSREDLCRRMDK